MTVSQRAAVFSLCAERGRKRRNKVIQKTKKRNTMNEVDPGSDRLKDDSKAFSQTLLLLCRWL